ncbi:DEAD/DEAH box helicase [Limibacillus halophilus]
MNLTETTFKGLGLAEPLLRALEAKRFTAPTPIQAAAIPTILSGRDLLGIAQTGTGKTGAFALPILQELSAERGYTKGGRIRALILAPTRELVVQIEQSLRHFGRNLPLFTLAVYGGVGRRPQIERLRRGADIVVATPGRFLDLLDEGHIDLGYVSHLVLDEADRMLDMGFIHDIRRIVTLLPKDRRSLLFSATMPKQVEGLARDILSDPERVEVERQGVAPSAIEQRVIHVPTPEKRQLLTSLLSDQAMSRVIVFTRTKHMANRVAEHLGKNGTDAEALHGNKSQSARQHALKRFTQGRARVLVATDIAARGIDVPAISHVVNFDLPNEPESYVHRIGRTARAGGAGIAVSFCDRGELAYLRDIERLIGRSLPAEGDLPSPAERSAGEKQPKKRNGGRPSGKRGAPRQQHRDGEQANNRKPKRFKRNNKGGNDAPRRGEFRPKRAA